MEEHYPETKLEDWGWWDRVKIFFCQQRYKEDRHHGWETVYYKIYKSRIVIIRTVRYH